MLLSLLGETSRVDSSLLQEAMATMDSYLKKGRKTREMGDSDHFWRKVEVWMVGLKTSLRELKQSVYASEQFTGRISKYYEAEMSEAEQNNYYRYVYFYKNGFIHVFAILDKLGALLNSVLALKTEKVKHLFSCFTVL